MNCGVLQKYAATQKMTGNEQARSGHFCLCGYGAKAPLTAKAVISGAGLQESLAKNAHEAGVGLRSRPRIAKQSRKSPIDGWSSLLESDSYRLFHCHRRLFAANDTLNWRKLFKNGIKRVRQNGVQRPKRAFGAELEAAEASNVLPPPCQFLFVYAFNQGSV